MTIKDLSSQDLAMNSNPNFTRNLLELNVAVFLISTSGVLGRYIDVPAPLTICLRSVLGGLVLYGFIRYKKLNLAIEGKDRWTVLLGGLLFGAHWITYFIALQLSNVAIGMLSLYTYPAITALLEPLIHKTKIERTHLILGPLILLGIYFLVPEFSFDNQYFTAIVFGVVSAHCYALRNILMKPKVEKYNGSSIMFYQLLVIVVFTAPLFFFLDSSHVVAYLPFTVILGLLTTAVGHTLFLYSFKNFSTVTASIISSMQPIYGILLGMLFLSEKPTISTLIGGGIILLSVIIESFRVYSSKN